MSSGVNRRTALKLLLAGGATGLAGVGGYGYLYERHELTVTRANLPVIICRNRSRESESACSRTLIEAAGSLTPMSFQQLRR